MPDRYDLSHKYILNPTYKAIRVDGAGNGHFGAPRSKIVKGQTVKYTHQGVDFLCEPGQDIRAPITGQLIRWAFPYIDDLRFEGLVVSNRMMSIKMLYVKPLQNSLNKIFNSGDLIGYAQDITLRYPDTDMKPHIHIEIVSISKNPENFII